MTFDYPAAIAIVLDRLESAGVAASHLPENVNAPGAWVDFTGRVDFTLGESLVEVEVVLVVPGNDRATSLAALQSLVDDVVAELGVPDGDIRKQSTVLPDSPAGLPSLVLPYLVA